MAKRPKKNYTQRKVSILARKLGMPGNIGEQKVADELASRFGYAGEKRAVINQYFAVQPAITDVAEFKPRKRSTYARDGFYESREWKELRYRVLEKHGTACQCCGAGRKTGAIVHVDHIKPRSRYPELELDFDNLQVLCEACNIGKSNKFSTDWRLFDGKPV